MNEEEKKAIETLKDINNALKYRPCFSIPHDTKIFDIILNLIEKQQKEIKSLENQLDFIGEQNKHIDKQQKEIEKLNEDKRKMLVELYKSNDKYDKEKEKNRELKQMLAKRIKYTGELEKDLFENCNINEYFFEFKKLLEKNNITLSFEINDKIVNQNEFEKYIRKDIKNV